ASKAVAAAAPTDQEIADAKAKGLVWVNTGSKVYHKEGRFYGKTKQGQFMTEADAQKAGYRAAKESPAKKSADTSAKKGSDNTKKYICAHYSIRESAHHRCLLAIWASPGIWLRFPFLIVGQNSDSYLRVD